MSTKPAHGITVTRWIRRVLAVVLVYNLGIGIYDFTMGHLFGLISFACVLGLAAAMTYQTKVIHRVERANRPRPDYSAIARMEREVYGETFEHEGAPAAVRPQRWDGLTTHPDTTEPASLDQYVTWLRGYVKHGEKPAHFYDYPFSRAGFRYAATPLTVDSDYEYGSSSRNIIVAAGVTTERTKPAGPFNGWAHTKLYFMHGYRTNDSIVPVYSDPEFDEFRSALNATTEEGQQS